MSHSKFQLLSYFAILFVTLVTSHAFGADPVAAKPATTAAAPARAKSIDFEDEVIEGMNKNPVDSLQHVGQNNSKTAVRLYRKRTSFRRENQAVASEMGISP